ncbi:hypothetical protein BFS06_11685 [Clostridium perfringens]|uniref:Leucine-rich cell surface protein n=1 Tax=Clostridium perfringens TaxID=1502 RepID=A0A140GS46_CLOPF|nr:leucine-rich repeat domain-containing protein [Clostridium perfringens]AMN31355.1 leucine-rich cell surface protein [Clostridium perfringens]TBX14874.1 hypothetical protein BFS06_11685 [Clostridium perfringens]
MKKNKIRKILSRKSKTLIVAGLVIASGTFLISKLAWKGKNITNSNNNKVTTVGKKIDKSLDELQTTKNKEVSCSIENPSDLADYEYAVINDELIEKQIKDRQNSIDPDGCTDLRGRYNNEPSCGSWKDDFRKRMTSLKGQIVITGYNGNKDNISIPSCINDKKVVAIGVGALTYKSLKKVNIPNSVIYLCTHSMPQLIESVEIPDSVKFIDDWCFFSAKLTSITIPKTVEEVGYYAFNSSQLQSVTIESASTKIDSGAFSNSPVSTINLPNGIKKIPNWAFYHSMLTEIKLPESVTEIGVGAFQSCDEIESLELPNNLVKIGDLAFSSTSLKSVKIPDSVIEIGKSAFCNCKLTSVSIGKNVSKIGDGAFDGNKLTSVTMPKRFDTEKEKYFSDYSSNNQVSNIKFNLI